MSLLRSVSHSSATSPSRARDPRLCGPTSRSGCSCRNSVWCGCLSRPCCRCRVVDEQSSRPPCPASQTPARSFAPFTRLSTWAPP